MKKKIVVVTVLSICVILVALLGGHNKKNKVVKDTKYTVPQIEEIPEGETKTYTFPNEIITASQFSWEDAQDYVDGLKEYNSDNSWFDSVELQSNGQVVMTVTQKQREVWFRQMEDNINKYIEKCEKGGVSVEIGENMDTLAFIQEKDFTLSLMTFEFALVAIKNSLLDIQMFMGVESSACYVYTRLERESTGEVVFDEKANGKGWEFMEDEWNPEEKK
ncbi:MAG: hypothetical protein PHX08_13910 [Lachnospiraceae bacterium]|nr:hypothetical protein [Lachnospiraceae bacterium]